MSNVKGMHVVFEKDVSEEKADVIKEALLCIRGVVGVTYSQVNADDYMNRIRIRFELYNRLLEVLKEE